MCGLQRVPCLLQRSQERGEILQCKLYAFYSQGMCGFVCCVVFASLDVV